MLAVDGSKLDASASDHATRSYEQIAAEILAEAGRIDAAEDELHGDARGDELPEQLTTPRGPPGLASRGQGAPRAQSAPQNPEPVPEASARIGSSICRRRLVEDWRSRAPGQPRLRGLPRPRRDERRAARSAARRSPHTPPAPEGKINTTDPDAQA